MTRVLVVDDHPVFRSGLRGAIEAAADAEWVGEAADGEEAIRLAGELSAEVVLMDLRMGAVSGVEATRRILARWPDTKVLVLTMSDDDESVFAAVRAGARGYLLKGAGEDDVAAAIAAVARGEAVFGAGVAARLLDELGGRRRRADPFPELSPREVHVLDLVASGLGNVAIAQRLSVSPKTIRNTVSTILTKLGAEDRADAVRWARSAGLGGPVVTDPPLTPDGHHVVVDGRRWRATDPEIPPDRRSELQRILMAWRREVRRTRGTDEEQRSRAGVQAAKVALGERGTPWWEQTSDERRARWEREVEGPRALQ